MRSLNDEEKEWLDNYYKETLNATFNENNSFFPIKGAEDLTKKELKSIKREFTTQKVVDYEKLNNKELVDSVAKIYKLPSETIVNIIKRKDITDTNNRLNRDYIKVRLRTTCEKKCSNNEDYYHYIDEYYADNNTTTFEQAMNGYLDWKHRIDMGWEELE